MRLRVGTEPLELAVLAIDLDRHERDRSEPWSVDDAPAAYIAGQMRAIVGVEVRISRIEAKAKLSQNRSDADQEGVIAGLDERDDRAMASAMRERRNSDAGVR